MKPLFLSTLLVTAIGFCACRALPSPDAAVSPFPDNQDPYGPGPSVALAGHDLAVPASPGTVRTVEEPWRTIEGAPSGRVRLLEMYQAAVAQRNRSAQRAADLERELEAAQARSAEAEKARADLESRNVSMSADLREIHAKALELARRLAQAELALLKAEKADLEGRTGPAARSRTP